MDSPSSHLRHRTPSSSISQPPTTSLLEPVSNINEKANKLWKPHTSSIQSIFWTGLIIFTFIIIIMIYYTTYFLPSSQKHEDFISNNIDDNETAPFGFNNYPFDVPYELRDISKYSKVVAIGDLHGDLSQTLKLLQLTGIVDENKTWIATDTILVQTGDIVDRGQESIEIYKLFFSLRHQALAHNSLVLQILGNHEMMNLAGDFRYVHSNEMYKYGTITQWKEIWSMNHKIGYFLRNTPIIRIVGNTLFVHAGLRPEILSIVSHDNATNRLNELIWKGNTLEEFGLNQMEEYYDYLTVVGNNGPVWTREFEPRFYNMNMYNTASKKLKQDKAVQDDKVAVIEEYLCEQLDITLDIMNVKRMVIGHNVQATRVPTSRCDGRLISIDVGISCAYGCGLGAATIDIDSDIVSIVTP